jgi:3-dehydroquinate dehydratase-1
VIAMGPIGAASRVFFPLLGSPVTYGHVGRCGAPGQLSIEELDTALRLYSPAFANPTAASRASSRQWAQRRRPSAMKPVTWSRR